MEHWLYVFIGLLIIILVYSIIEQKFFVTTTYKLSYDYLKNIAPLNFVVLSDLHNSAFGKNNIKLIKKIDELNPDFILLAGDMITKNKLCMPSNAYILLKELSKRYKIYYAYGNHEQKLDDLASDKTPAAQKLYNSWRQYKATLYEHGVVFLDNMSLSYINRSANKENKNINIRGLSIELDYYKPGKPEVLEEDYLNKLIGEKNPSDFDILIAHNPLYFPDYARWGSDLVISGHVHGGIIRLPFLKGVISPQMKLFPKYDAGEFSIGNSKMLLSRGLGTHSFMLRVFNRPELVNVIIDNKL